MTLPSLAGTAAWQMLAVDTLDDGQAAYDTFFLASAANGPPTVGRNTPRLALGEWRTLPVLGQTAPGLMLRPTSLYPLTDTVHLEPVVEATPGAILTPTATLSPTVVPVLPLELTFYQIAAQPMTAHPAALGRAIVERFGYCPPLPDPETVAQGWLSPSAVGEMAALRARWTMRAATYVYQTYRPHLLLVRQEALLTSQQALWLHDPRQAGYSPPRAAEMADQRRAVATAIDAGLDDLLATADLNYAALLVVSEHGLFPVHTTVNVAAVLQTAWQRLARLSDRTPLQETPPEIYLAGAFLSVESSAYGDDGYAIVSEAALETLAALTDPRSSEAVLARVARRADAETWAAAWPYPGAVLAQAAPGYMLSIAPGTEEILMPSLVYAASGYDARLPAMHGWLVAAGRGSSTGQMPDIANLVDVAPLAVQWLLLP